MSPFSHANPSARRLLQKLCKFIIHLARSLDIHTIKNVDDIPLGVEADDFITELENFLSSAQKRKTDTSIKGQNGFGKIIHQALQSLVEVQEIKALRRPFFPKQGRVEFKASGIDIELYEQHPHRDSGLQDQLDELQWQISKYMPIRVLQFEPYGSKLKINLLDRNAVYAHLSDKLQSEFHKPGFDRLDWRFDHTQYAALSHTWNQTPGELAYVDWQQGQLDVEDPKCQKVVNFCKAAWNNHGLSFGWIDTVCINKDSSSELDESIRSMFKWYSEAAVCITYLAETNHLKDMSRDPWFTRGWTLQELVAPRFIKFYNKHWEQLVPSNSNDKAHRPTLDSITLATGISRDELDNIRKVSISRRMQMAADRKVTREEDTAYSLMGIFDVSISTAYGEGQERAFFRLLKEIFDTNTDVSDIFNWSDYWPSSITSLFPQHPISYTTRSLNRDLRPWRPIEPLTLTHLGLRTLVLLMSALKLHSALDSGHQPIGDFCATVSVGRQSSVSFNFEDTTYALLRNEDFKNAMGTLNVEEHWDVNSICISKVCFALLLEQQVEHSNSPGRYNKIDIQKPIVFTLEKGDTDKEGQTYYVVRKDELARHGMKLVILYL